MSNSWVITFESVYYVMKAEKILKKNGFNVKLIPTPREVSSDCGMAIELICDKLEILKNVFRKNQLEPDTIYEWQEGKSDKKKDR